MKEKETCQGKAYLWLLDKITNRKYLPGMPLKEELIAQQINISATPVREALRRLEREGWVENIPYRGCFLKKYSLEEICELAILRENIEVSVIPNIIENISDEDWQDLDDIMAESETLLKDIESENGELESFFKRTRELDDRFHSRLIQASHCKKLVEMSKLWNFQLLEYSFQNYSAHNCCKIVTAGRPQLYWINEQHRAIYTAIRLKWEQAAKELVRAHISRHSQDVISTAKKKMEKELKNKSPKKRRSRQTA